MDMAVFLRRVAAAAAGETLPRFRAAGAVSNKLAAGFDPVTEADREAERVIRELIRSEFPGDGILGEEHGRENEASDRLWVIDPIDGTRAFISGIPTWGTLVGLTVGGEAVSGLMSQPFTGELYIATDEGAFYEGPGGPRRLKTRDVETLSGATVFTTTPALFTGDLRTRYDRLESAARLTRYGTDCYGFAMVAAGHADIAVDAGLQSYDIVALIPIIERAGGVVTTWEGNRAEQGGDIIAAATPRMHEAAMKAING